MQKVDQKHKTIRNKNAKKYHTMCGRTTWRVEQWQSVAQW